MSVAPTTDRLLGEGFAFFRWVCFHFPAWSDIHGWDCDGCRFDWKVGDR